ncbi:MAG: hypothetical protein P4L53_05920 [Candidatus Obscuribacterales bacterium]|nr:hypothetical protein [Candidatus Obscuribacterales bacterium]
MFSIDPSIILILFVVCPIVAVLSLMHLHAGGYDQLPKRDWLFRLPGYRLLYRKSYIASDVLERDVRATVTALGFLYLSVLGFLIPFANKLLGMTVWLLTLSARQLVLVLFFDLCIVVTVYCLCTVVKGLSLRSKARYRFLSLVGLGLLLSVGATCAMSTDVRLVVLLACKTTVLGFFGCLFFGALLFAINEEGSEFAHDGAGSRFFNIMFLLLSVGSLMSVVD